MERSIDKLKCFFGAFVYLPYLVVFIIDNVPEFWVLMDFLIIFYCWWFLDWIRGNT